MLVSTRSAERLETSADAHGSYVWGFLAALQIRLCLRRSAHSRGGKALKNPGSRPGEPHTRNLIKGNHTQASSVSFPDVKFPFQILTGLLYEVNVKETHRKIASGGGYL